MKTFNSEQVGMLGFDGNTWKLLTVCNWIIFGWFKKWSYLQTIHLSTSVGIMVSKQDKHISQVGSIYGKLSVKMKTVFRSVKFRYKVDLV